MEARWSGLRAAAPTSGGWAAPPPPRVLWLRRLEATHRGGGEGRGRCRYAPSRSEGAAAKTPSAAVPGTAGDLLFSFTKKGKGKKKERKGGRTGGENRTQDCCRDRLRPPRSSVGGKGSGGGGGAGKEGDWATGGPALGSAPRRRTLPPALLPFPRPEGRGWGGFGSPPVAVSSPYLARRKTSLDSHRVFPFPSGG